MAIPDATNRSGLGPPSCRDDDDDYLKAIRDDGPCNTTPPRRRRRWTIQDMRSEYALVREVGRGYYGVVRECRHRTTGEVLACKTMKKERIRNRQTVVREIEIMSCLAGHENIVSFKEATEDSRHVHILMEYCAGGDLCDEINRRTLLPEWEAASIFYQIANAVAFCHSNGIMHRDLKPENVLLLQPTHARQSKESHDRVSGRSTPTHGEVHLSEDDEDKAAFGHGESMSPGDGGPQPRGRPVVKLADFGQAVFLMPGEFTEGICGSVYYLAPELVLGAKYSHPADVWSLGIILYCLLSGRLPFKNSDKSSVHKEICRGKFDMASHPFPGVSQDAKELLSRMLVVDPKARITASNILRHPWLAKFHKAKPLAPPPDSLALSAADPPHPEPDFPALVVGDGPRFSPENSKPSPYSSPSSPWRSKAHSTLPPPLGLSPTPLQRPHSPNPDPRPAELDPKSGLKQSPHAISLIPRLEALLSTPAAQLPGAPGCENPLCSKCCTHDAPSSLHHHHHPCFAKDAAPSSFRNHPPEKQQHEPSQNFNLFPGFKAAPPMASRACDEPQAHTGSDPTAFGRDLAAMYASRGRLQVA